MLLPLHDDNPLRHIRFGYWTAGFIAACVLLFAYQALLPDREGNFLRRPFSALKMRF